MDVLLVIDMQQGLLAGEPKHDLDGVVARIDRLAERVRQRGGHVVFVQHDGTTEDGFAPESPGWQLLDGIRRGPEDRFVRKKLNDSFYGTSLAAQLAAIGAQRLLVTGWATDLCVDATVRTAAASGHQVVVVADGHTVADRPHLDARRVIEHHHWIWTNLIAPRKVAIEPEAAL